MLNPKNIFCFLLFILLSGILSAVVRQPRQGWTERDKTEKNVFSFSVKPHSFRVFRFE
jgi:hypothetical protein